MIPRLWQKTPTCRVAFLLSLPLRNLDVISQGYLGFFQIILSFSHKIMWFFDDVGNILFTFLR